MEQTGKTAIVTGGASGVGLGIAKALAGAGRQGNRVGGRRIRRLRLLHAPWPESACLLDDYVLTHAGERTAIKARHERIEAAFDRAETQEKTR